MQGLSSAMPRTCVLAGATRHNGLKNAVPPAVESIRNFAAAAVL
jgi:hypothetical protein